MTERLMEYFNRQPRIGVISTSNKNGTVDCRAGHLRDNASAAADRFWSGLGEVNLR